MRKLDKTIEAVLEKNGLSTEQYELTTEVSTFLGKKTKNTWLTINEKSLLLTAPSLWSNNHELCVISLGTNTRKRGYYSIHHCLNGRITREIVAYKSSSQFCGEILESYLTKFLRK